VKEALHKEVVEEVVCGGYHVMARTAGGWKLYSWGLGDYGQLGLPMTSLSNNISSPQRLKGIFEEKRIAKITCGGRHSFVATDFTPTISFMDSSYKSGFHS
jgi:alpha-tubulin suppressor-like RCC1 family protein